MSLSERIQALTARRRKTRTLSSQDKIRRTGILMVLPAVILFGFLRLIPSLQAFYLSFTNYTIMKAPTWVGLDNYIRLFQDKEFFLAVYHTLQYMFGSVFISAGIALFMAILLNRQIRFIGLFRTAYYLPQVASWVAVSMIWIYILNPSFGVVNFFLSLLHIPKLGWLNDPNMALESIILVSIWRNVGYDIVIYLAGLQAIPTHLYEAARVDGANAWQVFQKITFPLLLPTTMLIIIVTSIFALQVFDQVYVLTGGGPANATTTVVFHIWQNAFQYFRMGYASAMAFALFALIFILSLFNLRLSSLVDVE